MLVSVPATPPGLPFSALCLLFRTFWCVFGPSPPPVGPHTLPGGSSPDPPGVFGEKYLELRSPWNLASPPCWDSVPLLPRTSSGVHCPSPCQLLIPRPCSGSDRVPGAALGGGLMTWGLPSDSELHGSSASSSFSSARACFSLRLGGHDLAAGSVCRARIISRMVLSRANIFRPQFSLSPGRDARPGLR